MILSIIKKIAQAPEHVIAHCFRGILGGNEEFLHRVSSLVKPVLMTSIPFAILLMGSYEGLVSPFFKASSFEVQTAAFSIWSLCGIAVGARAAMTVVEEERTREINRPIDEANHILDLEEDLIAEQDDQFLDLEEDLIAEQDDQFLDLEENLIAIIQGDQLNSFSHTRHAGR